MTVRFSLALGSLSLGDSRLTSLSHVSRAFASDSLVTHARSHPRSLALALSSLSRFGDSRLLSGPDSVWTVSLHTTLTRTRLLSDSLTDLTWLFALTHLDSSLFERGAVFGMDALVTHAPPHSTPLLATTLWECLALL